MDHISTFNHINIYTDHKGHFIVHNMRKHFHDGHTHIDNYDTAKYIAYLAAYKRVPKKHMSDYLIESVIRLSSDEEYILKMREFQENQNKNKRTKKSVQKK